MSKYDEIESFKPESLSDWRSWLDNNHEREEAIWLIIIKKSSNRPNLSWNEAVDQALCFGWVDGEKQSLDKSKYEQFFSKRKADKPWSKINKEKIEQLIKNELIAEGGHKAVEIAKGNGAWEILDSVEALQVPDDLSAAFEQYGNAFNFYNGLKKGVKKSLLTWVVLAKTPETRTKIINEIAENASFHRLPEQFQ